MEYEYNDWRDEHNAAMLVVFHHHHREQGQLLYQLCIDATPPQYATLSDPAKASGWGGSGDARSNPTKQMQSLS